MKNDVLQHNTHTETRDTIHLEIHRTIQYRASKQSNSHTYIYLYTSLVSLQIRGVEVGIVVLVLIVWVGAIALFFNRWGKIRMLLPYQPDYKEQLKVPGTGVCASANAAYTHSSSQHACSQVTYRLPLAAMQRNARDTYIHTPTFSNRIARLLFFFFPTFSPSA